MHLSMHLNSKMRPMILVTASLETVQVLPALQVSAAVATASCFFRDSCSRALRRQKQIRGCKDAVRLANYAQRCRIPYLGEQRCLFSSAWRLPLVNG